MKKVGIIGGAGPLASALFYEKLIFALHKRGLVIPEILLINYPFTRGLSIEEALNSESDIRNELSLCIDLFKKNGVEIAVLVCNTLHRYLSEENLTFLFMPEQVILKLIANRHQRPLLLATENTINSALYYHPEIAFQSLSSLGQRMLDQIIERLLKGEILKEDARTLLALMDKEAKEKRCDAVILGCSDLTLLYHHFSLSSSYPIYDSVSIAIKSLVTVLGGVR